MSNPTMYELNAYRYDCVTAQRMIWDISPDRLKEREPHVFTGEYAYKISRLSRRDDGAIVAEIVETSPSYVSWLEYEYN